MTTVNIKTCQEQPQILVNIFKNLKNKYICNAFKLRELPKALMETLTCNQCGESKIKTSFVKDGAKFRKLCKMCKNKNEAERRKQNIEIYKNRNAMYYKKNKGVILERNKKYRIDNNEAIKEQKKEYYNNNKSEILQYHQDNKEIRNEKKRIRFKTDQMFRISESLKSRIHDLLKNKKETKTNELIGCSKDELKKWLEYQFDSNIRWDNYSDIWHIDHVVPINFFDLADPIHQQICFHWTNLRPLNAKLNLIKSSNIICDDIIKHINTIKMFHGYQTDYENSWWRRIELRYGNNPKDVEDFKNLLKWAIRSQDPKSI